MTQFLVLTFGLAWLIWLPLLLAEHAGLPLPVPPLALILLGACSPSATALWLTWRREGATGLRRLLGQALRWRAAPAWYALALLGPAAVILLGMAGHALLGGTLPDYAAPGARWLLVAVNLVILLFVGGPLGEEFGWRGLALGALEQRFGRWVGSGLLGVVWAVWHLPLFFVSASAQHGLPFWLYALQTIPLSMLMAWVYHGAGDSLLLALLLHAAVNTWSGALQVAPVAGGSTRPLVLITLIVWVLALLVAGYTPVQRAEQPKTWARKGI